MVKNEADIVGAAVRHLFAEGVDGMVVAENGSSDETLETLRRLSVEFPIKIVADPEPAYYQAKKMTALANLAGESGADWVIPFDADEIWCASSGTVADTLRASDEDVVAARVINHLAHWRRAWKRDLFDRLALRERDPYPLPKVAFRYKAGISLIQGNHGLDGLEPPEPSGLLEIRHFQYRSFRQFHRKVTNGQRAYALTDLPSTAGGHWRALGQRNRLWLLVTWIRHCARPDLVKDRAPVGFKWIRRRPRFRG